MMKEKRTNVHVFGQPILNKGFTLIELLAVIVILAIIALIATPIILNIINDSQEESDKRSIDLYAKAIQNAVAREQIKNPSKVIVDSFSKKDTEGKSLIGVNETELNVEYDGTSVTCETTEVYKDGSIYLSNCSVGGKTVEYTYGTKQVIPGIFKSVCEISEESSTQGYEKGTKYNCKVDPNRDPYTFYVLTTPEEGSTSINLIMNSNIDNNGNLLSDYPTLENVVHWDDSGIDCNGPQTAMKHLYEATDEWKNINPLNYEYYDSQIQSNTQHGYESFISKDGILRISECRTKYIEIGTKEVPLRARMPVYTENSAYININELNKWYDNSQENIFLYDNLEIRCLGKQGYWTLSKGSNAFKAYAAIYSPEDDYNGFVDLFDVDASLNIGVRPVINLEI